MKKYHRILVFPDLHCPYEHQDAFCFLAMVQDKYRPDKVVSLGDELDFHSISFHDKDPDMPFTPSSELKEGIAHLKEIYEIFPKVTVIDSNHGSLVYRRMKWAGIPKSVLRPWGEILEAPKSWEWTYDLTLMMSNNQPVYFHHGLGQNVLAMSQLRAMCFVQGHHHSSFEVRYWANSLNLYWGVTSGCLIDHKSLAFAYAKNSVKKPMLGCTMILDGIPKLIPMIITPEGRWNKKVL